MEKVGVVKQLYVYPVKSMQAVPIDKADLWWYGLDGDRKYGFVRSDNSSGFPWLTGRQVPDLLRYRPYFATPVDLHASSVRVRTPYGRDWAIESPELLDELSHSYGSPVHLMQLSRGTFDAMPVSLISTTTVRKISQATGQTLDSRRFRPNVVIEPLAQEDSPEDTWLEKELMIGDRSDSAQLQLLYRTKRCVMINLDPDSAQANAAVLRMVADTRETRAGVYATVSKVGPVRVGDALYLLDR